MKHLVAIILFLISTLAVYAQELKVSSMKAAPMDLSASTHMRRDANGDPCALVKVVLRAEGASFEGNIVGDTEFRTNEYWVYMTAGSKMLQIKHISADPTLIRFTELGVEPLQGKQTYILMVSLPQQQQSSTTQKVVINFSPSSAMVIIDGKVIKTNNGVATATLTADRDYDYMVAAEGYDTSEGSFRLKATSPTRLNIQLYPESGQSDQAVAQQSPATPQSPTFNTLPTQNSNDAIKQQAQTEYAAKNYNKAMELFKQIPDDRDAQFQIGYMYNNGWGTARSYSDAVYWFRKSAEQGNARAQNSLGVMYRLGHGVKQSDAEAASWYKRAADQGNYYAQSNLAFLYKKGFGVTKSDSEAAYWYRKAAEQGYADSQVDLGLMYENGTGVQQSYADAMMWYRKASEQNNYYGQYNLGTMYEYGKGVEKSYTQALYWYQKAAEQGYASAQTQLGYFYLNGYGTEKDYAKAFEWSKKAAEQNNATGMANLGFCYYYGRGTAENRQEAQRWMRKAADAGNEWAKKFIAENTF